MGGLKHGGSYQNFINQKGNVSKNLSPKVAVSFYFPVSLFKNSEADYFSQQLHSVFSFFRWARSRVKHGFLMK